jgi:PAS domain S-box-containing protein
MALLPALVPLGVSLSKICRNAADDGPQDLMPRTEVAGRAIVNKMIKGGANAPITQWSEAKLEKAIRRNSVFRDHANELRLARVNGVLSKLINNETEVAQVRSPIAPVVGDDHTEEEGQDSKASDMLSEADLLLLAAEAKSETNPTRDARDAALEVLADNSFDALLITDMDGIIAYSNKAFTKLTGYEQEDVIGKTPKLLQGPGTDKKVLARLKDSMSKGLGNYEGSAINYRKDGTPFIMWWRVVPVKVCGEIKAWAAIQREGSHIPGEDISVNMSSRIE